MYKGFKEGRRFSPNFDADYYIRKTETLKDSNLNLLVYYSVYRINKLKKL